MTEPFTESSNHVQEVAESSTERVSQEKIGRLTDRFSEIYDINLPVEVKGAEIEYISDEDWASKLSESEIKGAFGIDIPINSKDLESFKSNRKIPLGEWIRYESKGYIAKSVKENLGDEVNNHIIAHELIHAIAFKNNGGLGSKGIMADIFSEEIVLPERNRLNEGITELLAIGLSLGTDNIDFIKKVVEERVNYVLENGKDFNELSHLPMYLEETSSVLLLLYYADISLKELADYYCTGDYNSLSERIFERVLITFPGEEAFSEENFPKYNSMIKNFTYLGMSNWYSYRESQ